MTDTTVVTGQQGNPATDDRRIAGNPVGKKDLESLCRRNRPFYYQLSRPDLGKGCRSPVMVCGDAQDYAYLTKWHSSGTLVWAEPMPADTQSVARKPPPKPTSQRDYSYLPGEPTDDLDAVRTAFKQGHFKYQFAGSCTDQRRSRVMRCTDDDELAFILRQLSAGARVYIEQPKPST